MRAQSLLYARAFLRVSGLGATASVEYESYTNPAGDKFPIAIYDNVAINSSGYQPILSDEEQKAYFANVNGFGQVEDSKKHQSSLILSPGEMALFRYKK